MGCIMFGCLWWFGFDEGCVGCVCDGGVLVCIGDLRGLVCRWFGNVLFKCLFVEGFVLSDFCEGGDGVGMGSGIFWDWWFW